MKQTINHINDFGQTINCGCASCEHRDIDGDGVRLCRQSAHPGPEGQCPLWQLRDGMRWAGCGRGRIKRKDYLMSVLATRLEERLDMLKGYIGEDEAQPVQQIRQEYENENGSIYAEF